MFEFLSLTSAEQTVDVANHAIRLIEWRYDLPRKFDDNVIGIIEELSSEQRNLTMQVISEIQQTEKVPFAQLDEATADKYLLELSNIVHNAVNENLSPADLRRGRQVLEMWKEEVPEADDVIFNVMTEATEPQAKKSVRAKLRQRREDVIRSKADVGNLSDVELQHEAARLKESLFRLNFKLALGEVDAIKQIRKEKKSLTRIQSLIRQRDVSERHS